MEGGKIAVLIVDDEEPACTNLSKFLSKKEFKTFEACNGVEALKILEKEPCEIVLLDIKMPVMGGLEALGKIKNLCPDTEVIMVTALSDLASAIESMKQGAFGYLTKPLNLDTLFFEIDRSLEHRKLLLENKEYQARLEEKIKEQGKTLEELKEALAQVKTLSGLFPICASCKKIRDDKGYWNQIESYITERSDVEFSHGICPECMKKLYHIEKGES